MRISDWSSDVCSSDLPPVARAQPAIGPDAARGKTHAGFLEAEVLDIRSPADRHQQMAALHRLPPSLAVDHDTDAGRRRFDSRSEERRVGNECVVTCISSWSPYL